jgi:O-antigen/teichoic acid export membrane protein
LSQSLLQGIGGAAWAPLADLHARGEHDAFNRRLVELTRVVAILSVVSLGPIVAYNRHFVGLWMPPTFPYGGDAVVMLSALNAFLLSQLSLWGWCFGATGKTARLVPLAATSAIVNVIGSIVMTRQFGIIGPLLGTTLAFVTINLWWLPWLLREVFGASTRVLAKAVLVPLACGVPPTLGLWWFALQHQPLGAGTSHLGKWVGLALEMTLAALFVSIPTAAPIFLNPSERNVWRQRLRTVLVRV